MKIIGISGRKQSGKNTAANYINGQVLKGLEMIEDFYIDDDGRLAINTKDIDGNSGYGILDVTRKDRDFVSYAEKELWPYIKIYHFADILKELSINIFGLSANQVYGSDKDKNTITRIAWDNLPLSDGKTGYMSSRDFLQYFGTTIVRKIYNNAWVDSTLQRILTEQPQLAIIPDIRFPNEVEAIKKNGGIVIRLTRNIANSQHESEMALDKDRYDWSNFDSVIDNEDISIEDFCDKINSLKTLWN
jgi:hypothetical protein